MFTYTVEPIRCTHEGCEKSFREATNLQPPGDSVEALNRRIDLIWKAYGEGWDTDQEEAGVWFCPEHVPYEEDLNDDTPDMETGKTE